MAESWTLTTRPGVSSEGGGQRGSGAGPHGTGSLGSSGRALKLVNSLRSLISPVVTPSSGRLSPRVAPSRRRLKREVACPLGRGYACSTEFREKNHRSG